MHKKILTACTRTSTGTLVDPADLGLYAVNDCPGLASHALPALAYNALVDCIQHAASGDRAGGKVADYFTHLFTKISGSDATVPHQKPGGTHPNPRAIVQMSSSNLVQGGTVQTLNEPTAGGGETVLYAASCSGGNGNKRCLNNADCGSGGTCIDNPPTTVGGVTGPALQGSQPVFDPNNVTSLGNTLTITGSCALGIATCLVTHTLNAGNGTSVRGAINYVTGQMATSEPTLTDLYLTGVGIVDCDRASMCPRCSNPTNGVGKGTCMGICNGVNRIPCLTNTDCINVGEGTTCVGGGTSGTCSAPDQSTTIECSPSVIGGLAAQIPNPFTLTTEPTSLNAASASGVNQDGSGAQICGFCDTSATWGCQSPALCLTGCQTLADCKDPAGNSIGATVCDFSTAAPGFNGDGTVTAISTQGLANQYAPILAGLYCAGQTQSLVVNSAAGLPGPVRVISPYINTYYFSKE